MSTTRSIDEKIIRLDGHRPIVLNILAEVLANEGLSDVAVADLTPGAKTNLSTLIENLKSRGGWVGGLLLSVLPTDDGQAFSKIEGRFREQAAEIYDKYSVDWVDMLRGEKNLRAKNINSAVTNSSRVLIAEIFDRIIFQALREDSKLPIGKNRSVWVTVMANFTSRLLNDDQRLSVELESSFKTILGLLLEKWTDCLMSITKRLEDLNLADKIINEHTSILEAQKLHGMRYIIAHLAGIEDANIHWSGEFKRLANVKSNLVIWEKRWVEKKKKEIEFPTDSRVLVVSKDSKRLSGENKWQLKYEESDFGPLEEMDSEKQDQIIRQKIICSTDEKGDLKKLYAWMGFHTRIISMVKHIGEMYRLGGWIPFFMEAFELDKIDKLVEMASGIFKSVATLATIPHLSETKIYSEIRNNIADVVSAGFSPLHKFTVLGNDELLIEIKNEFVYTVKALIDDGKALGCNIISDRHIGILGRFLEPKQKEALDSHRKTKSSQTVEDVTDRNESRNVSTSSSSSIVHRPRAVSVVDETSKERKLKMRMFEMKVEYIVEFFKARKSLDMMNDLYDRHKNGERLDFILKFGHDDEFDHASPFVNKIKNIIRLFEAKVNLSDEKSQTDLKLWAERLEEVFCLKFLCMESMRTKSDSRLIHFCEEMEQHSNTSFRYWFFKSPKRYDKLLVAINPLLLDAKVEDRISDGELDLALYQKENEELKKVVALKDSENSMLKAKVVEQQEEMSKTKTELAESKSQTIEAKLSEKKSVEEKHSLEKQLHGVLAAQKTYLEEVEEKRVAEQKMMIEEFEKKRIADQKMMAEEFEKKRVADQIMAEEKRKADVESLNANMKNNLQAMYEMMQKDNEAKLQAQRMELEEKNKIDVNKAKVKLTEEFASQRAGYLHTIEALQALVSEPSKRSESSSTSVVPVGVFAANLPSRPLVPEGEISSKAQPDQKLNPTGTFG